MRRIACFLLALIISVSGGAVVFGAKEAKDMNKAYWPLQTAYEAALAKGDNKAIIETGTKIYELLNGKRTAEEAAKAFLANGDTMEIAIIFGTAQNVARAAEAVSDLEKASAYYKIILAYCNAYKHFNIKTPEAESDFNFLITELTNKIKAFSPRLEVFARVAASDQTQVFLGGKFEPKSGVYYGLSAGYDPMSKAFTNALDAQNPKKSSGALIYAHFLDERMASLDWLFKAYKERTSVIEVGWNLTGEGAMLDRVLSSKAYIIEEAKYLQSLGANILLRFGAEMNVWSTPADPGKYIEAFRLVSSVMKENAPNVAMVFAPNDISAAGLTYEMFYPGDEYVDWVGISCYSQKYFLGDKNLDTTGKSIYMTDEFANPVERARPIVEAFGARKPILISEGGVENFSVSNNEDVSDWAALNLTRHYAYLPMVFPQIKAMFYFDKIFDGGVEKNIFAFYKNARLNELYKTLTDNPVFLAKGAASSEFVYKPASGITLPANSVPLFTYFIMPYEERAVVDYRLDGSVLKRGEAVPYEAVLDLSSQKDGEHILDIEALSQNGKLLAKKTVKIIKNGGSVTLNAQ